MLRRDIRHRSNDGVEVMYPSLHEPVGGDFDDGVRAFFSAKFAEEALEKKWTHGRLLGLIPLNLFTKSMMLKKSNTIVEEDLVFLENNKEIKTKTGKRDLLIKSDEVTFEFTKLWNRNLQKDEELAPKKDS